MHATQQRIVINDLIIACRIGVTDQERASLQRLRINLTLDVRPTPPCLDRITEVVNYGPLTSQIRDVCAKAEFRLLETMAGRLAATCFQDHRIERVCVRVEKLDHYQDMAAVGCEISYERDGT